MFAIKLWKLEFGQMTQVGGDGKVGDGCRRIKGGVTGVMVVSERRIWWGMWWWIHWNGMIVFCVIGELWNWGRIWRWKCWVGWGG